MSSSWLSAQTATRLNCCCRRCCGSPHAHHRLNRTENLHFEGPSNHSTFHPSLFLRMHLPSSLSTRWLHLYDVMYRMERVLNFAILRFDERGRLPAIKSSPPWNIISFCILSFAFSASSSAMYFYLALRGVERQVHVATFIFHFHREENSHSFAACPIFVHK